MKLYLSPGACSLASHMTLRELGADFDVIRVDTQSGQTETGADYRAINPKGYVPSLELDEGQILTEGPAILQYLADTHPEAELAPPLGTLERARMLEVLTFTSSELHKAFSPLFRASSSEAIKTDARAEVSRKMAFVEALLADGREHVTGATYTIADAYLFVVSNWAHFTGIDLNAWPNLSAFVQRVSQRPATQAAMKAEGLI
ncbi:glutathione transferase GstA [Oceanicaulis sp. MMSF_3324]|uniref:glutathione transferase GstA n=1 Tax=Oceanicaulis sp. MMSF_3324 TaxID=3046702 RepID=UPI003531B8F9